MGPERRRERLALADELVRVAPDASRRTLECEGHVFRFIALVESGDIQRADAALAAARSAARSPIAHWTVLQWEAVRALLAGRLADAEALSRPGGRGGARGRRPASIVEFSSIGLLWCIRAGQGRLAELEPLFGLVRALPDRPAWSFAGEAQLAASWATPTPRAAAPLTRPSPAGLLQAPRSFGWATTMIGAADVCAALEDRSLAAPLYELLAPCADVMIAQAGPVGRAAGGSRSRSDAGPRPKTACERPWHSASGWTRAAYLAIARYTLGRLLLPSAEGMRLVEQAAAAAEELAMPGWLRRANAALADGDASYAV